MVYEPVQARLSVVVGTFDRHDQLRACINSIFEHTRTPVRLYVTDAGSTDGTVPYLESMASERLVPIFEGRRRGQAAALNDVFARVDTPYVCWLSDDNVVVDASLDVAVDILDREASIGMVGLKVKDLEGPFVSAPYIGGLSSIGILNVNQGVLRTEVLRAVGGFSEAFRDYGIDPDLTAKVLFSGHDVVYTRRVAVHHTRNWSVDRASPEYARLRERQQAYLDLYEKKYGSLAATSGTLWKAKKAFWNWLQAAARVPLNSERRVLGQIPRDWHNVFSAQFIILLDPLRTRGRSYHLVQSCPPGRRPASLPEDPLPSPDALRAAGGPRG